MNHWDSVRARARALHAELSARAGGAHNPKAILDAASSMTGIERIPLPPGDPLLYGSADAVLYEESIWFNNAVEPWQKHFFQAHEYAHHWLHNEICTCATCTMDNESSEGDLGFGIQRVEGYGPHERRELEANVFAREFLLPSDLLRRWFLDDGHTAVKIAALTEMPHGMVCHQLTRALLGPEAKPEAAPVEKTEPPLDESQKAAALVVTGPAIVEAGPGTGKTRTLIGRLSDLLITKGVAPEHILTLTYSNKAAEEMRIRAAKSNPELAPRLWLGTFHAFGLETLRKHGSLIGLSPKPLVMDPVEAIDLLERSLADLKLNYYQHLSEPTFYLRDVLGAISRAKDELKSPEDYRLLGEEMRRKASDDKSIEDAEKALEVARIYKFYDEYLRKESLLDYGDLILRTVELLQAHPVVRDQLSQRYRHILVDEYQDVNTASKVLLKLISGDGSGLWVVGDALQAIYRFRGAAPANMRDFSTDFRNSTVTPLRRNYRSLKPIVAAFSVYSKQMAAKTPTMFMDWSVNRTETNGTVIYEVAVDDAAEAEGIASEIFRLQAEGVAFKDQAILARSHGVLQRLAPILESRGVPLFYLGDLFERPEIRDLLALMSVAAEPSGSGLLRVGTMPEYGIDPEDVLNFVKWAEAENTYFPKALGSIAAATGISSAGKEKLSLLADHLDGLCFGASAWQFLTSYLLDRSSLLRELCAAIGVEAARKRFAVYQLIQFAYQMRRRKPGTLDPKRDFLNYIRQLEIWGEERQLRQLPAWAADVDAVRMMTVHASKGLEFRAVFVPALGNGKFPSSAQGEFCPPPPGLTATQPGWKQEEEECLFFVALSRAQDHLCLSRAMKYGKSPSKPSPVLTVIQSLLNRPVDTAPTWTAGGAAVASKAVPKGSVGQEFTASELDSYMRCPHQYFVDYVLNVKGSRADSGYLRFHKCVHKAMRRIRAENSTNTSAITPAQAIVYLAEEWEQSGPVGHLHEVYYRREGERMISEIAVRMSDAGSLRIEAEWTISLVDASVTVKPDWIETSSTAAGERVLIRRIKTGRRTKSAAVDPVMMLYQHAARSEFPNATRSFDTLFLLTGEEWPVDSKDEQVRKGIEKYQEAADGIRAGEFQPKPNDRTCPKCPHYFICPGKADE
jgi:DNA helicase II / ATP-dependent DNA helicase PcrA